MGERMRRLEVVFSRAPIYFVTACTHERRKILARAEVYRRLLEFAEGGPVRGAWLGAVVLMPDHWHAFVALDDEKGPAVGDWVKGLKNALSRALRDAGCESPHWQRGFFDHVLRSDESYAEKWDYVRENPVRHGLVGN